MVSSSIWNLRLKVAVPLIIYLFVLTGVAIGEITPAVPPDTSGVEKILPPPPAPTPEAKPQAVNKGFFGWSVNSQLNGQFLLNRGGPLTLAVLDEVIIDDPQHLGEKIGLAEDALEYRLGGGLVLGSDLSNNLMFSLPFYAGVNLYLKEGWLFGYDPFVGFGVNLNLLGTDFRLGGLGFKLFGGIVHDFSWPGGRTELMLGYNSYRVEGSRLAEGVFVSLSQPLKL